MNIFQPLLDKADAVTREANALHDVIKDCHDLMNDWQPADCPRCEEANNVRLISVAPTINAPQAHGIAIHCFGCGLQTAPEYWHESEPQVSAYSALYDVYGKWGYTETKKQEQA